MLLADTGYFVAVTNPADFLHSRAVAWTLVLTEKILVTEYVFLEAMNALSRQAFRPRSYELAARIVNDPVFEFLPGSTSNLSAGLALYRDRIDKEWSLTDRISFAVMQERKIRNALTHDRHFVQAGFDALLQRDP